MAGITYLANILIWHHEVELINNNLALDAVCAVLTYTQDPMELLKRKKIYRDHLFKYLASESVVVSPNADKHELMQAVLRHWGLVCIAQMVLSITKL